jgi:GTP-binding protein
MKLDHMITEYIRKREQLVNVFVLIDIRHEQHDIDRQFVDWLGENSIPFSIIFTKADKIGKNKVRENVKKWMDGLKDTWEETPPYFITSSLNKTGRDEILDYIEKIQKTL